MDTRALVRASEVSFRVTDVGLRKQYTHYNLIRGGKTTALPKKRRYKAGHSRKRAARLFVFPTLEVEMSNEIGLAIRLARVATGKSQWDLAKQVNIHPVVINYIERGRRTPDAETVKRIFSAIEANAPKSPLAALVLKESRRVVGAAYAIAG